jgi:long-subunit fatty acid transport protein
MNIRNIILSSAALAAISLGILNQAKAAGYEKSIMWGGRSAGVAGIATPYISGSQALYFNPAGLVGNNVGQDVSLNVSPTWAQFKGPINNQNDEVTSSQSLSWPFGVVYGMTLNEDLGWGVGIYASGGAQAKYDGVTFAGIATPADIQTNLAVYEIAGGVGYKVSPDFKVGAAYRVVMAQADFAFVQRTSAGSLLNLKLSNLKDTEWTGFKLGAQYKFERKHFAWTDVSLRSKSESERRHER